MNAALSKNGLRKFAAVVAVVASGIVYMGYREFDLNRTSNAGIWVLVSQTPHALSFESRGKVVPNNYSEIVSPANGYIVALHASVGQAVVKGQLLASINSPELAAQLRTAEAAMLRMHEQQAPRLRGEPADVVGARRNVLEADAALQNAKRRASDLQSLYLQGFVARFEKEAADAEVRDAQSLLEISKDELAMAQLKYSPEQAKANRLEAANKEAEFLQLKTTYEQLQLIAPFNGVLLPAVQRTNTTTTSREISVGSKISAGDAVFAIGDTSQLGVQATCNEVDLAWLKPGLTATIELAIFPYREIQGSVAKIGGERLAAATSLNGGSDFECTFHLPRQASGFTEEELKKIRLGGSATVRINHLSGDYFSTVPINAVSWLGGTAMVRWREAPGTPSRDLSVRLQSAGFDTIQLHDRLAGEVWVPASNDAKTLN